MSEHFSPSELACKHCGQDGAKPALYDLLERIRAQAGPLAINSGYRCPGHPIEAKKKRPGMHSTGLAADIRPLNISLQALHQIITTMPEIRGVGVDRMGNYIHLDLRTGPAAKWVYLNGRTAPWSDPWRV